MTASADPSSAARTPPQKRAPDFFIAGNPKSGTTALYEMLRRHPQIYMPDVKELYFFSGDRRPDFSPSNPLPKTLDEYLSRFAAARPEQRVGDATPSYLKSHTAAASIAEVQPDARIIAIFREPASFLRSLHMQSVQYHAETETDLRKAMVNRERVNDPRRRASSQTVLHSEHVRYVEQLRRFHAVFPTEQVLVLIYEDFRRDNEAIVRQVLRFLEVDDTRPVEVIEANPTVRVRSPQLHKLVRSVYLGRGAVPRVARAGIKALTPTRLRRNAVRAAQQRLVYGDPRPPDEELMLELRRRFKGEVVALSEYLDRDLVTLWGYDSIT